MFRIVVLGESAPPPNPLPGAPDPLEAVGILLILRAFASGSVALTGTEAIANGVPAFKPPEAKNAATTLMAMAVLLAILFIGHHVRRRQLRHRADGRARDEDRHQPGRRRRSSATARIAFYLFQAFTALILFLAANTCYNAFPRLAAILARGRLHAPPVRVHGRSPRLHRRDRHPVGRRDRADRGVRRRHARADPALFGRRVPRVHDQPDRHGAPLAARARARLARAPRAQRLRRGADRCRGRGRDRRQGAAVACWSRSSSRSSS